MHFSNSPFLLSTVQMHHINIQFCMHVMNFNFFNIRTKETRHLNNNRKNPRVLISRSKLQTAFKQQHASIKVCLLKWLKVCNYHHITDKRFKLRPKIKKIFGIANVKPVQTITNWHFMLCGHEQEKLLCNNLTKLPGTKHLPV